MGRIIEIIFQILWYLCIPAVIYAVYATIALWADIRKQRREGQQYTFYSK